MKMKDRGGNIKRQIMFSRCAEAVQDVPSRTGFISHSNSVPQLSRLVDFTQALNPDVKLIGTSQIYFLHVCLNRVSPHRIGFFHG